jgi:hypothetical protein
VNPYLCLCVRVRVQRPPGIRAYVLVGVSTVVRNMPGGLLFNMHVHEPIRRLLATTATSDDHAEVISLVRVVVGVSRPSPPFPHLLRLNPQSSLAHRAVC